MRTLEDMINSGKTLTRKETAAVERFIWSESEILSLGIDGENLKGEARKAKVKWYKTWSNK